MVLKEPAKESSDLDEFLVGNRFPEVAGAKLGGLTAVRGRIRGSDDESRDALEFINGSNPPQHFESVDLGKIQVEQEKVRGRRLWVLLRPLHKR